MVYLPQNKTVTIDLSKVSGVSKNVWWFDPRSGISTKVKSVKGSGSKSFTPPKEGQDWVLVIDDAARAFNEPGNKYGNK